jgi:hypothetical protein
MRGYKILLSASALIVGMAIAPAARAQIVVGIGVQPVCSWGYYDYAPYACAPTGFYGPGYFYNGIFLGMGPWAGWGYGHGWGDHRFVNSGGGRYNGGGGEAAARGQWGGHSTTNVTNVRNVHNTRNVSNASRTTNVRNNNTQKTNTQRTQVRSQGKPNAGVSRNAHAPAAHSQPGPKREEPRSQR